MGVRRVRLVSAGGRRFTHRANARQSVLDFDNVINFKLSFDDYVREVLHCDVPLLAEFQRLFRVVESETLLASFASDRSHMLVDGEYQAEPPLWPLIEATTPPSKNNLFSHFVDMENKEFGEIYNLEALIGKFGGGGSEEDIEN